MSDLTFSDEGNENSSNEGLVNFDKRIMISQIISGIQQRQNVPYQGLVEESDDMTQKLMSLPTLTEKEAYDLSVKIEPRKK